MDDSSQIFWDYFAHLAEKQAWLCQTETTLGENISRIGIDTIHHWFEFNVSLEGVLRSWTCCIGHEYYH